MLAIELHFPTGRFHANPWGRHVNEGVPEWPPSPYRLERAIFDAWKRKRPDWPASRVEPLLRMLAVDAPRFYLPPARASHTRSYLSQNTTNPEDKSLIFDAFVVLLRSVPIVIGWPDLDIEPGRLADLNELFSLVNYFGRSESWVCARADTQPSRDDWNCVPADGHRAVAGFEIVPVACPVPPDHYEAAPYVPLVLQRSRKGKHLVKAGVSARPRPLPWLEALAFSTGEMFAAKLSDPPALRFVNYLRPARCFDQRAIVRRPARTPKVNGVLYALECKVPPPVTATLEIAEQARRRLMGIHRKLIGGDPRKVSPKFSGKDASGNPLLGHRHAFFLPQDRDRDGSLDHLLVVCAEDLDEIERRALDRLDSLYQRGGRPQIRCTPVQWGVLATLLKPAKRLTSVTPFVPSRHYRKGRGDFTAWLLAEVRREAATRGLPEISRLITVPRPPSQGRSFSWLDFRRNRKDDSPKPGYGFEIEFAQPVAPECGPLALGYGAHFGLGQFRPA